MSSNFKKRSFNLNSFLKSQNKNNSSQDCSIVKRCTFPSTLSIDTSSNEANSSSFFKKIQVEDNISLFMNKFSYKSKQNLINRETYKIIRVDKCSDTSRDNDDSLKQKMLLSEISGSNIYPTNRSTSTIIYDSIKRKFIKTKSGQKCNTTLVPKSDNIKNNLGVKIWTNESANPMNTKLLSSIRLKSSVTKTPYSSSAKRRGKNETGYASTSNRSNVPASVSTNNCPTTNFNEPVILALVEGRGHAKGEIGLASINLKTPNLIISQFPDNPTYAKTISKLHVLYPIEIIMPSTVVDKGAMSELMKIILHEFPNTNIVTIKRQYFKDVIGYEYITSLSLADSTELELEIKTKYYAASATAALFKYIECVQNIVYAPGTLNIAYVCSENTMLIDTYTAKHLELIENLVDKSSPKTLFGCLNYTRTRAGARLLRANLLQPPKDKDTINIRYECVEELLSNETLFYSLKSIIHHFNDFETALALCAQIPKADSNVKHCEWKIGAFIDLKHNLKRLSSLKYLLLQFHNPMFVIFKKLLDEPTFAIIESKLDNILVVDHKYLKKSDEIRNQKCMAVKAPQYSLLEVTRGIYANLQMELLEVEKQINQKYKLGLRVTYNQTRGYFLYKKETIKISHDIKTEFPEEFVKISKANKGYSMTTIELLNLNDRINQVIEGLFWMSSKALTEAYDDIREHIGCLYKLAEALPLIDLMVSYANWASLNDTVKPIIAHKVSIQSSRHPIIEKFTPSIYVPNSIVREINIMETLKRHMSRANNFSIITGPNMAGKTTYLKQIALIQIMSQIGCHIPCHYAEIKIFDRILSFFGCQDDIENNLSTQMTELKRIKFILQNANSESLIFIDELGIATGTKLGAGLSYAVSEELIKLKSYTYFATHFKLLCRLEDDYPMVNNFHLGASFNKEANNEERLQYSYKITPNAFKDINYGLKIFEQCSFPEILIHRIKESINKNDRSKTIHNNRNNSGSFKAGLKTLYKLAYDLYDIAQSNDIDNEEVFQDKLWRSRNLFIKCFSEFFGRCDLKNSSRNNLCITKNFQSSNNSSLIEKEIAEKSEGSSKGLSSFMEALLKTTNGEEQKVIPSATVVGLNSHSDTSLYNGVKRSNEYESSKLDEIVSNIDEDGNISDTNVKNRSSGIKRSKYFGNSNASQLEIGSKVDISYKTLDFLIESTESDSLVAIKKLPCKRYLDNLKSSSVESKIDPNSGDDANNNLIETEISTCDITLKDKNKLYLTKSVHITPSQSQMNLEKNNHINQNLNDQSDESVCFKPKSKKIEKTLASPCGLSYFNECRFNAKKVLNFTLFDDSLENSPMNSELEYLT